MKRYKTKGTKPEKKERNKDYLVKYIKQCYSYSCDERAMEYEYKYKYLFCVLSYCSEYRVLAYLCTHSHTCSYTRIV